MAKAIFITDMPKKCNECNLRRYHSSRFSFSCGLIYGSEIKEEDAEKIQKWCPLREVPQKKRPMKTDRLVDSANKHGYNACIDEILGGGE